MEESAKLRIAHNSRSAFLFVFAHQQLNRRACLQTDGFVNVGRSKITFRLSNKMCLLLMCISDGISRIHLLKSHESYN